MSGKQIASIEMPATQSGCRINCTESLVNAALIGPKGTAALQHECDPLERRALCSDVSLCAAQADGLA